MQMAEAENEAILKRFLYHNNRGCLSEALVKHLFSALLRQKNVFPPLNAGLCSHS